MQRTVVGGIALGVALLTSPASSQIDREDRPQSGATVTTADAPSRQAPAPATPAAGPTSAPSCIEPVQAVEPAEKYDPVQEQQAFEREAQRYVKLREFTQQLEVQRRLQLEKEFEETVSLFIRKQTFTQQLVAERERTRKGGEVPESGAPAPHVAPPQQ